MLGLQTCATLLGSSQSSVTTVVGPPGWMMIIVVGDHLAKKSSAKGTALVPFCQRASPLLWHDVWVQKLPEGAVCWMLPGMQLPFCLQESVTFPVLPGWS